MDDATEDKKKLKQQYSAINVLDRLRLKKPTRDIIPVGSAVFFLGANWPVKEVYKDHIIIQYGNSPVRIEMKDVVRSMFKDDKTREKKGFDEEQIAKQVRSLGKPDSNN